MNITVKVNPEQQTKLNKSYRTSEVENFELNDLKNVDTTTVTPSEGDTIVFDITTQKFELL